MAARVIDTVILLVAISVAGLLLNLVITRASGADAAIFSSKAAARNPVLAANLAFNTTMTRKEALAVLEGTPPAQQPGAGRAARNPNLGAGAPVEHNAQAAAVDRMAKKLAQFARR